MYVKLLMIIAIKSHLKTIYFLLLQVTQDKVYLIIWSSKIFLDETWE